MDTEDLGARLVPALRVITLWIAGLLVLRWVLQRNGNFLFLLLLAWLLAIAMDPGIRWFASRGLKRGMATGAVMLSLIVLSAAFLAAFGGVLFARTLEEPAWGARIGWTLVGLVVLAVLSWVPFVGGLIVWLFEITALGALVITLWTRFRSPRPVSAAI